MIKKLYKPFIFFVFAFLISLPVILPYFHTGYFPTHDGEWAVVRLTDMYRSIRDHQFPVRYSGNLNFGYGYPLFNFVYPAPYYIGVILHFLKLGFVDTIKLLFAGSVILSALTMYLASSEIWKNKYAGIISAVFYIYLPYRIVDLYARGSIGESLSFALFPLIIFFAYKIIDSPRSNRYSALGSLSYALLILTHNIMALLFSPVLLLLIAVKILSVKIGPYLKIFTFLLLSYGLSAFFWIPALLEKHNIILSRIPIANRDIYFVKFSQLIIPKWGYGLPDQANGFSYQLGVAQIIVLLTVVIIIYYSVYIQKKKSNNFNIQFAIVAVITTLGSILLMFPFTNIIWKTTPLLREINYPWTLLSQIGLIISLLSGFLWIQKSYIRYFAIALCLIAILFTVPYAKPEKFVDKGDGYYLTNDATTTSSDELMPIWVKKKPLTRWENKVAILKGQGIIENVSANSKQTSFDINSKQNSTIQINTIFWAGWNAFIDGKMTKISYNNPKGLIILDIPSGKHQINIKFQVTTARLISDFVSVGSLVIIGFLFFKKTKSKA